jgi:hypothetical protein
LVSLTKSTYLQNSLCSLRLARGANWFEVSRGTCRRSLLVYCWFLSCFDEEEVQSSLVNEL